MARAGDAERTELDPQFVTFAMRAAPLVRELIGFTLLITDVLGSRLALVHADMPRYRRLQGFPSKRSASANNAAMSVIAQR